MKKIFFAAVLLLTFTAFKNASSPVVAPYDKADFSTQFKAVFEAAKKRFVSEIGARDNAYSGTYSKKYAATIAFKNASAGIVEDEGELKTFQTLYSFDAATLDEAKEIKKQTIDLVKSLLPADYKNSSTYTAGYAGYMTELFEYNSDIFAEISKRPVVRVGIILVSEGKYTLEILVSEPVFKMVDRPVKEKK